MLQLTLVSILCVAVYTPARSFYGCLDKKMLSLYQYMPPGTCQHAILYHCLYVPEKLVQRHAKLSYLFYLIMILFGLYTYQGFYVARVLNTTRKFVDTANVTHGIALEESPRVKFTSL